MLRADEPIADMAHGVFADPIVHVSIDTASFGDDARFVGYSFAQFAMPVWGSRTMPFVWNPARNVFSPPCVMPFAAERSDGSVVLLAPLSAWHEQVFGVDQDANGIHALRWGWHGDLDRVDEGFETELGIFEAASIAAAFAAWGDELQRRHPVRRHRDDPLISHVSYWTDNGAAYWYRTEPGLDLATTIEHKIAELDELGIEIGTVELDSWFYRHEVSRPVTEMGPLDDVPPTGLLEWQPRADVLPAGVADLQRRLDRPLALHSRHIAKTSPLVGDDWWVDLCAHPSDPSWFARWFEDAASWGATCIEQDWMLLCWFGNRQLRAEHGRPRDWLAGLNQAAAERDMALVLCMALPGDLIEACRLDRVIAVRTCDDYRYATDPARLWRWYLTVNRFVGALGIPAFKDCFFTSPEPGETGLDGDHHAEAESVLAAFSAGIVGIGDRLGCTDPALVARLVDADGRIATGDRPLAITDASFFDQPASSALTWAETSIGDIRYVVALHLADDERPIAGQFGLEAERLVYEWRSGRAAPSDVLEVTLSPRDWALFVCCPIDEGTSPRTAEIGDVTRYATAAGTRVTTTIWTEDRGVMTVPADQAGR